MSWFKEYEKSLDPSQYICTHKDRADKSFCPKKAGEYCMITKNGEKCLCPFLAPKQAFEGRGKGKKFVFLEINAKNIQASEYFDKMGHGKIT